MLGVFIRQRGERFGHKGTQREKGLCQHVTAEQEIRRFMQSQTEDWWGH